MNFHLRTFALATAGFVVLLTCGCSTLADARRLSWVKKADPQLDCEAAIRRRDLRFCGVNGYASGMVPGTDQFDTDRAVIQSGGIRIIEGTSDCSNIRLNQRASQYTRDYNTALLAYLHARHREALYRHRLADVSGNGTRRDVQKEFPEIRIAGGPRTLGMAISVQGESHENYRLDRDFLLHLSFVQPGHQGHKVPQAFSHRPISANEIDSLLFGSVLKHPSARDRLVDWDLSYNPLPPGASLMKRSVQSRSGPL